MLPAKLESELKKSDIAAGEAPTHQTGVLRIVSGPADLARYIFGCVHRDEPSAGAVVRVLPEVRCSIQVMVADPYWLCERGEGADWRRLPRVSLWGPRYAWCYGFAAQHIKAYAVGLSAAGFRAVTGVSAPSFLNRVCDLGEVDKSLLEALSVRGEEPFDIWMERATARLREFLGARPPVANPVAATLGLLSVSHARAVARAAVAAGLSERQYRRVFRDLYGVSPKQYQRTVRVDRMIRQLHPAPWEGDAFADEPISYADQPHAIREFRALTGTTPRAYLLAKKRGELTLRSAPVQGKAPPNTT